LDACAANYCDFPMLDNAYIFPADVRLTLYRDRTRWALALEALGFSPKAGNDAERIILDLHVFGNCLAQPPGLCTTVTPATSTAPLFVAPWPGKVLAGARLSLRGREVYLPTAPEAYHAAGIALRSPPDVWGFEALRVLLPGYRALLLATETERCAHIPPDLPAILQLDEWRHPNLAEDELPSHTETFQQLAAVLYTGDPARYAPNVPPNTHWRYWPHGGDGVFFGNATALEG
jgi:hypothetical protein